MVKSTIRQLYRQPKDFFDKEVSISGWVRTERVSKNFGFIEVNDGTFFKNLQVVFEDGEISNFKEVSKLSVGSAISVSGILVETPNAKQPFEIKAKKIDI